MSEEQAIKLSILAAKQNEIMSELKKFKLQNNHLAHSHSAVCTSETAMKELKELIYEVHRDIDYLIDSEEAA